MVKGFLCWMTFCITVCTVMAQSEDTDKGRALSFKKDVYPIIDRNCLPCHSEDNFNPSELTLDTYQTLKTGGQHGTPFRPGNSKGSLIIQKLSPSPPFEDRMPLNSKRKIAERRA